MCPVFELPNSNIFEDVMHRLFGKEPMGFNFQKLVNSIMRSLNFADFSRRMIWAETLISDCNQFEGAAIELIDALEIMCKVGDLDGLDMLNSFLIMCNRHLILLEVGPSILSVVAIHADDVGRKTVRNSLLLAALKLATDEDEILDLIRRRGWEEILQSQDEKGA